MSVSTSGKMPFSRNHKIIMEREVWGLGEEAAAETNIHLVNNTINSVVKVHTSQELDQSSVHTD